jgi:hypothetical protein
MFTVSRTTQSKYCTEFNSSMVGFSVDTVKRASRSFDCIFLSKHIAYKAHVVAVLYVKFQEETQSERLCGSTHLVVSWPAVMNVGTSAQQT